MTRNYLLNTGDSSAKKAANKAGATRDDLVKAAQSAYASASSAGGSNYASVTSYLSQATDSAKKSTFDTWSESELKSYLDSYGVVRIAPKLIHLYKDTDKLCTACPSGIHHKRTSSVRTQAVHLLEVWYLEPLRDPLGEAQRKRSSQLAVGTGAAKHRCQRCSEEGRRR